MHHRSSAPHPRLNLQSGTNDTQSGAIAIQSGAIDGGGLACGSGIDNGEYIAGV
jgi:hypothetical protein